MTTSSPAVDKGQGLKSEIPFWGYMRFAAGSLPILLSFRVGALHTQFLEKENTLWSPRGP